ncbi:MAG: ribonuclease Z [Saprospiraceae bacterium]|nr:ribonuclease Z [Saprospiraceae bacterium]
MGWNLLVLGSNAAVPTPHRFPSSQLLNCGKESLLFDCGEGTQMQITRFRAKAHRIRRIFISHLHGDHCFGLPGLLTSLALTRRTSPLDVYGPPGIHDFVYTILRVSQSYLPYDLKVHEHQTELNKVIVDSSSYAVETLPLSHRIPTAGFKVTEKIAPRKLNAVALEEYKVPYVDREALKQGHPWRSGEVQISNELLTVPNRKAHSFAYCSDTSYDESLIPLLQDVTILYHEATFGQELEELATKRYHSTTRQAARIAKLCGAGRLVIGHFSSRYEDLSPLLAQSQAIFPSTSLAEDGAQFEFE